MVNGVTIPKGAVVTIPIGVLHYSPVYWTDPEKFDPERLAEYIEKAPTRLCMHNSPIPRPFPSSLVPRPNPSFSVLEWAWGQGSIYSLQAYKN